MTPPTDPPVLAGQADLLTALPARVWYLTRSGGDMWCRRPYGFWFSSSEAAGAFAAAMGVADDLTPIALDARDLITDGALAGLRELAVTRIFLDPRIDPDSGDVHGPILRLADTA